MSTIIDGKNVLIMKRIIVICGPTGIGKTSFSIALAKAFDGEIIGADSMQIYKYMNIGTAKPDAEEMKMVRHHLVVLLIQKSHLMPGNILNSQIKP